VLELGYRERSQKKDENKKKVELRLPEACKPTRVSSISCFQNSDRNQSIIDPKNYKKRKEQKKKKRKKKEGGGRNNPALPWREQT
jgi:hypothetical protein